MRPTQQLQSRDYVNVLKYLGFKSKKYFLTWRLASFIRRLLRYRLSQSDLNLKSKQKRQVRSKIQQYAFFFWTIWPAPNWSRVKKSCIKKNLRNYQMFDLVYTSSTVLFFQKRRHTMELQVSLVPQINPIFSKMALVSSNPHIFASLLHTL